ncbi:mitochondrial import receptor subunit TOM22 homolog [Procambarus clarkii]|uniref:mitochondrial import receptor subunit TOM22 homolog n=1 Tax=Procambarus clarkii TaxID=6728 RepID=UPI001E66FF86|nr:mitochondrial import receptor subunit TOM22 homolog [Procambarus clarkii]
MATLIDITDRDSGVASSEATPESQMLSPTAQEEAVKVMGEAVEAAAARVSSAALDVADAPHVIARVLRGDGDADDVDDDEDVDESLGERIWGLTEMFPERLRTTSVNAVSTSLNVVKSAYDLTRQVVWIAVSTSVILFAPVMFELERLNVEEMMKQDRNRLVLGPGSAMSGPPIAPGLMPPPPTR